MECDSVRDAISAEIDGEDPGLSGSVMAAHLARCMDCRGWQQRAHAVTRRIRLGGAFLDHDLTPAVLATIAAPARWRPRLAQPGALIVLALARGLLAWQARAQTRQTASTAPALAAVPLGVRPERRPDEEVA